MKSHQTSEHLMEIDDEHNAISRKHQHAVYHKIGANDYQTLFFGLVNRNNHSKTLFFSFSDQIIKNHKIFIVIILVDMMMLINHKIL